MLEVGVVRFQRVFEIRWLSLGNCVAALIKNYQPLMAVLGECAATGDATAIGESLVNKYYKSCPLTGTATDYDRESGTSTLHS